MNKIQNILNNNKKNVFTCSKAFSIIESLLSHFLNKELSLQSLNFVNCSKVKFLYQFLSVK